MLPVMRRRCLDVVVSKALIAQHDLEQPLSALGSIRTARSGITRFSSSVRGTSMTFGHSGGNNSSSTTTAGRSLFGSFGKASPRQSARTISPGAKTLPLATTDRSRTMGSAGLFKKFLGRRCCRNVAGNPCTVSANTIAARALCSCFQEITDKLTQRNTARCCFLFKIET